VDIEAALAATPPKVTTINEKVRNRILILDVERLDGITQQHWWDRGDLKNRYIHHETVIREPRTTIVCAKWYFDDKVMRFAEWDRGGRGRFLERVHGLISRADVVVGHNVDGADVPWLLGDFHFPRIGHPHRPSLPLLPDIGPTGAIKTVDTLKILRKKFKSGLPFKGLDAALKILGHPGKTDRYDRERMERAVAGDKQARIELLDYCEGDVWGGQWMYDFSRAHHKTHPALFIDGKDKLTTCNRCGHETDDTARRYVANVLSFSMRKCSGCGAYSRLSIEPERMSIVRGV
jgi:hypothetical protein